MSASCAVSTPAPYIGGKKNLSRRLVAMIETVPHRTYAEPFVGMGGVFLKRRVPAKAEVINDISRDVTTLYRILQRHYEAFMDMLKWQITSRTEFARLLAVNPDALTDLERAARFLYLQRTSFGGKVAGRNFGVSKGLPGRFNVTTLEPRLEELRERLAAVTIEQLPYAEFIRRYDAPDTLFYLDPPYFGREDDYGAGLFSRTDFEAIARQLANIRGKFILSINDAAEIRTAFSAFTIDEIETTYALGTGAAGNGKRVTELIIRN